MSRGWLRSVFLLFLFVLGTAGSRAQDSTEKPLYLVARPELGDPFFQESVIVMLPPLEQSPGLAVGVIVNKPIHITLKEIFPQERSLQDRSDPVYLGGPVDAGRPGAIFRAAKAPKRAMHLLADLYVSFDGDFIVGLLKKSKGDGSMRIFMGRAQWAPSQLRSEMMQRAWYGERAESSWIFSQTPQDVWRILLQRAQPSPLVSRPPSPAGPDRDWAGNLPNSFGAARTLDAFFFMTVPPTETQARLR
jgi:putative transcriptional regulator